MRLFGNQALQQYSRDLLPYFVIMCLEEEIEQNVGEVVGVRVRETQLIGDCVKEQEAALSAQ
jgi:hypothetical protein